MPNGKGKRKATVIEKTRLRRGRNNAVAPAFQALPPPVPKPVQQVIPAQPRPRPAPRKVEPCGGNKPFAQISGGATFCTQQDFLNAGFRIPGSSPKPKKTCPPGFKLDSRVRTGRGSGGSRTARCRRII